MSETLVNCSFGVVAPGLSMVPDVFSSVLDSREDVVEDFMGADEPPGGMIFDCASRRSKMLLAAVFALAISGLRLKS